MIRHGEEHPRVGIAYLNYGKMANAEGLTEEARTAFERALVLLERGFGPDHRLTVQCRELLR